ncbi:hypothetical protein E1B28_013438 [Marasmius oreades]|uniref:Uncharacterized protein n=1 Tax=Marasmius oreades TaxID=181124 RepID=A0A9P7RPS6_9AGAR|nr:uncharacterized protein E1B28_013438 [Marasmius oreades]KAG7087474.1 hypothetical protein E1B28_013438 [Marasmius oreades]
MRVNFSDQRMGQQHSTAAKCSVCKGGWGKSDKTRCGGSMAICNRCTTRRFSLHTEIEGDSATITPSITTASTVTLTVMRGPRRPRTAGAEDRPSNSRRPVNFSRDSARAVMEKRRRLKEIGSYRDEWQRGNCLTSGPTIFPPLLFPSTER